MAILFRTKVDTLTAFEPHGWPQDGRKLPVCRVTYFLLCASFLVLVDRSKRLPAYPLYVKQICLYCFLPFSYIYFSYSLTFLFLFKRGGGWGWVPHDTSAGLECGPLWPVRSSWGLHYIIVPYVHRYTPWSTCFSFNPQQFRCTTVRCSLTLEFESGVHEFKSWKQKFGS